MSTPRRTILVTAAAATTAMTLAACGGGAGSSASPGEGGGKGGKVTYYLSNAIQHLDPQRMYAGIDISNTSRMVYRTLVAFPISTDPAVAFKPVPDLATDTGSSSDHAKTWKFTLRKGVTWQDGKPVTCADLKYGASRVFATDVITGGPNYLLTYLDIPTDPKTGLPAYTGPYTKKGQDLFDKAVTCDGATITYHFKKPWPDFPLAIAALHMMDPYRQDKDQGDRSSYQVFSNGPYELKGTWDKTKGGDFVRNPHYDPSTDSPQIRKALPDQVRIDLGKTRETIADLLIADNGDARTAVTGQNIPPAYFSQITGAIANRTANVDSPYVDYLVPNFKRLTNLKVRQALAMATNTQGWIDAGGGEKAYAPAKSIVPPTLVGYRPNPAFANIPAQGDPAGAKKLLEQAGVKLPYPLTFTYESSPTADKQARALKETWDQAGFRTTLAGEVDEDTYYTDIQKPDQKADVVWASWGADWPSAITVTAPLFDSRPNLTKNSNGQDYGAYKSAAFNKLVDQAQAASTIDGQTAALQQADAVLGQDVAYIPLELRRFYFLYGSGIANFMTTPASNMNPDLGPIGVK
jgi:peptide/nickel transport system substrate-binding protein